MNVYCSDLQLGASKSAEMTLFCIEMEIKLLTTSRVISRSETRMNIVDWRPFVMTTIVTATDDQNAIECTILFKRSSRLPLWSNTVARKPNRTAAA